MNFGERCRTCRHSASRRQVLHRSGVGAAHPLPLASLWPGDKDEVSEQVRTWASHPSAPGGGISKKTVEKRRDVTGQAGPQLGLSCTSWLQLLAQLMGDMSHEHYGF